MSDIEYRRATADDLPALSSMLSVAFGDTPESIVEWLERSGLDSVRTLLHRGTPQGCALHIAMGQYFAGRSVPMTGIAGVTIAPEARGKGRAAELMRRCVAEIQAEGVPLSVLYASTQALYRVAGYEQAGHLWTLRVPVHRIDVAGRGAPFRPATDDDMPAIDACYARAVRHRDGYLDRTEYIWKRIRKPRVGTVRSYVLGSAGGVDAYVFFRQSSDDVPGGRHNLLITDMAAVTPDAARSLLAFLRGFSSMAVDAIWQGGPVDPLLTLLPEQSVTLTRREYWMLRIADVAGALTQRAYAPGLAASLHLHVTDDALPSNAGPIVLSIADGAGHVERGGDARIRLGVRALASIYTGFHRPESLAALGLVESPEDDLRRLGAAFAGAAPAMSDMF